MICKRMNLLDIEQYQKELKNYLYDIISLNIGDAQPLEVDEVYKRMVVFSQDGSALIYGAYDSSDLVGFIWGYRKELLHRARIHISYIGVRTDQRGKGIGGELLNTLVTDAKHMNIEALELMVTVANERVLRFYTHEGFAPERILLCKQL